MGRDVGALQAALRGHLIRGESLTKVKVMSTGHSNETYLLEGLNQILRMPPFGTPLLDGLDMARQFQLFAVLGRMDGAPPVPKVIYHCEDVSVLGAPFYIVERMSGQPFEEYALADWFSKPPDSFRESISRQYLIAYASLSKLEPLDILGPIASPIDECRRWRGFAAAAGDDTLTKVFDRLIDIPAPCSGPPAPINGDAKPANILWLDGKLHAVLDWELAINGEPLAELGYMLAFFESDLHGASLGFDSPGMWKRDHFITEWERSTGRSATGLEWFEAASGAKMAAIMAYGYHLTRTGQSIDARMAGWLPTVQELTKMAGLLVDRLAV